MTDSRSDAYEIVTEALADGKPVDWVKLAQSGAFSGDELRALKLVEEIHSRGIGGSSTESEQPALPKGLEFGDDLGHGSHGRVVSARDLALDREVAVKILGERESLSPEARSRILSEARTIAGLDHPNIVRIHGIEEIDGRIQVTFEKVRGRTLEQVVAEQGPLAPLEAAHVALDLCRALSAIHQKGVVHRDLKPANVMRAEGGRIVLLDFGIAASSKAEGPSPDDGAGTPLVMAPEQFQSQAQVDGRTDLFALGNLLYWMVSGRFPFAAGNLRSVRERVMNGDLTPLTDVRPDIPPGFAMIVHKALAHDPDERFSSAGEFELALRQFVGGVKATRTSARPWRPIAVAALLVAGLSLALIAFFGGFFGGSQDYRFDAQMCRREAEKDVPLHSGEAIHLGDKLVLKVEMSEPLHVYVLNEDEEGVMHALFPFSGGELNNPITRGNHRLPGTKEGDPLYWPVNNLGGGAEYFLVVASQKPVPAIEDLLNHIPSARSLDAENSRDLVFRSIGIVENDKQLPNEESSRDRRMGLEQLCASLASQPLRREGKTSIFIRLRTEAR